MAKDKVVHAYILLDASGSMQFRWDTALQSINSYVAGLRDADVVTVAFFSGDSYGRGGSWFANAGALPASNMNFRLVRDSVKKKNWNNVSRFDGLPNGGTPLNDASVKLLNMAEANGAEKTVVVMITDGEENASVEFTAEDVKKKVKAFEAKEWEVIFLGANYDNVIQQAADRGGLYKKSLFVNDLNLVGSMQDLSARTMAYAATGARVEYSDEDRIKAKS